jgi:hypothetical protein
MFGVGFGWKILKKLQKNVTMSLYDIIEIYIAL